MGANLVDVIWTFCYLSVLLGLSAYGIHRYFIIYLFLKNRKRAPRPLSYFKKLPIITIQLPIFNEIYVVERLLKAVSELDYPRERMHVDLMSISFSEPTAPATRRARSRPVWRRLGENSCAFSTPTSYRSHNCLTRRCIFLPTRKSE